MKRKSDLYLHDMLTSINRIKDYTQDLEYDNFTKNQLIIDAVLRNLEIIGEAVNSIDEKIKFKYSNILWRDIKDFRNVVAHKYFSINLERIWDILENELDILEKQIEKILKNESN